MYYFKKRHAGKADKVAIFSKWALIGLLLALIIASAMITGCSPKAVESEVKPFFECGDFADYTGVRSAQSISGRIVNPIIYIAFSGEDVANVRDNAVALYDNFLGADDSLRDYYSKISYGKLDIYSYFPYDGGRLFIYEAPQPRSYYANITAQSGTTRYREESTLLNDAVRAATEYFDFSGEVLDVNGDRYVDSVTFLISGTYNSSDAKAWGGLLWPHSWELDLISGLVGTKSATLGGVRVNYYSFNFISAVDTGLLCHETGHVLGMPDLYHYTDDVDNMPVLMWDLMHSQQAPPQYPTVYLRDKYLGVIGQGQVEEIIESGYYSLKPVATAGANDVLAYKIQVNSKESIWMEYRNNSVSTYDSQLPGSGLIVYRTNSDAEGNEDGKYRNPKFPDEVYVYRPTVATTGALVNRERRNLSYAYLSPNNGYFTELGGKKYTTEYNEKAIYLSDGTNTGIRIVAEEISDENIRFFVELVDEGTKQIADMYVEGNSEINYGEELHIVVKLRLRGSENYVTADPDRVEVSYDKETIGKQMATATYTDDNGNKISRVFTLTINDMALGVESFTAPTVTEYVAGMSVFSPMGLSITVKFASGAIRTETYSVSKADKWDISGVDMTRSGVYEVRARYIPYSVSVYFSVTVITYLRSISLDETDSLTLLDVDEELKINVLGLNADGTEKSITSDRLRIGTIRRGASDLYKEQTIEIRSRENATLTTTKRVIVIRKSDLSGIVVANNPKTVYRYGESLDLSSGVLQFTFGSNVYTVPMSNYHSLFKENYDSAKRGSSTVNAVIYGVNVSFIVTVTTYDGSILRNDNAYVNVNGGFAVIEGNTDLAKAEAQFKSYLNVRYLYNDGEKKYLVSSATHGNLCLSSAMSIVLINDDGQTLMTFRVYVRGDVNGDGVADSRDIKGWAAALNRPTATHALYLDMNGDGVYNLTDFILLYEKYGGING